MTCARLLAVSFLAVLLSSCTRLSPDGPSVQVVAEFVGSTPGDRLPREFIGGLAPASQCHDITWRLTLLREDGEKRFHLNAAYHVPSPANTNRSLDGPKVVLGGTWQMAGGSKTIYRIATGQRSLSFVTVGDDLLHLLAPDGSLMVGNGGWSYTLNRAGRTEKPGDPTITPDMSYTISAMSTGRTVFAVFEGRSPCLGISEQFNRRAHPGCVKAKWRVTLYQDPATGSPATYKVEGTLYLRKAREGTWRMVRGIPSDPNAVIYRLDPYEADPALSFLKGDENVLFFLDRDLKPMVGHEEFSYTLNRVRSGSE